VGTGFRKRSRTNKKLERDDDSTKNHPALRLAIIHFFVRGAPGAFPAEGTLIVRARAHRHHAMLKSTRAR
jgi:hypothetical protein